MIYNNRKSINKPLSYENNDSYKVEYSYKQTSIEINKKIIYNLDTSKGNKVFTSLKKKFNK